MKVSRYNKLNVNQSLTDQAAVAMARLLAVLTTQGEMGDDYSISLADRADCLDSFIIEARKMLGIEVHKCQACRREESVCSADPCEAVIKDRNS